MNTLLTELRRRNVFRVAMVYAIVGWLLMQLSTQLESSLNLPLWFDTFVTVIMLIGFPLALILAWAFEMTPEGVKPTTGIAEGESLRPQTGRKLNYVLGLALAAALALLGWQNFAPGRQTQTQANSSPAENEETTQSIAVLPFDDFSADNDQEYFANGISEELLNVLARIDGLRVASRTSAFAFKGRDASMAEIAEALDVGHVLEGSIRKSGTTLRITAQLIDTSNDEHLWSETYDRALTAENIFIIQDEIAKAIVGELKGRLEIDPQKAPARTVSLEAYELYLRSREQMNKRLSESLRAAVDGFKKSIEIDPNFAPAYSGLADTYLLMDGYAGISTEEGIRLAKPSVARALELAPNSAESLTTASLLATIEMKPEEGLEFAERAIEANPNYAAAYLRKSGAYSKMGQTKEELAALQKARELDPLSGVILNNIARIQKELGDRSGAKSTYEDNKRWNPGNPFGLTGLASMLHEEGDFIGAHEILKDAQALNPNFSSMQDQLVRIYGAVGMNDEALATATLPRDLAYAYLLDGDFDAVRKLSKNSPDPGADGISNYFMKDWTSSYAGLRIVGSEGRIVERPVIQEFADFYVRIAYVFRREGDEDAAKLIANLKTYLDQKQPAEFNLIGDLKAGALLQIYEGNPSETYVWIDHFLNQGFADLVFLADPMFDEIRNTPEFKTREKRMAENAASLRATIKAQLANPKPNWVTPE